MHTHTLWSHEFRKHCINHIRQVSLLQDVCPVSQPYPTLLLPRGLQPAGLLCPWNSPGKHIGVGGHFFLQGIFLTQGSNPGLSNCRQILYQLSHQGSPRVFLLVHYYTCNAGDSFTHYSFAFHFAGAT